MDPNADPNGTIHYTLDGSDSRHVEISLSEDLVAYEDERYHHVPTSDDDAITDSRSKISTRAASVSAVFTLAEP